MFIEIIDKTTIVLFADEAMKGKLPKIFSISTWKSSPPTKCIPDVYEHDKNLPGEESL